MAPRSARTLRPGKLAGGSPPVVDPVVDVLSRAGRIEDLLPEQREWFRPIEDAQLRPGERAPKPLAIPLSKKCRADVMAVARRGDQSIAQVANGFGAYESRLAGPLVKDCRPRRRADVVDAVLGSARETCRPRPGAAPSAPHAALSERLLVALCAALHRCKFALRHDELALSREPT